MTDETTTTVLPAPFGWYGLDLQPTGELVANDPIVGWVVAVVPRLDYPENSPEVFTYPATLCGRDYRFLLRPDGVVVWAGDEMWPSLNEANEPEGCAYRLRMMGQAPP